MEDTVYVEGKTPDLQEGISKAWVFDDLGLCKKKGIDPNKFASLRTWIIFAPWAHPVWSYYVLFLVHLRPIEGMPEPKILLKNASHELMLYALNPDHKVPLNDLPYLLTPANFVAQFYSASDGDAINLIDQTASDVVAGRLNPDTDYMQHWIARFGASNVKGDPQKAGETKIIINPGEKDQFDIVIPPVPVKEEKGGRA